MFKHRQIKKYFILREKKLDLVSKVLGYYLYISQQRFYTLAFAANNSVRF